MTPFRLLFLLFLLFLLLTDAHALRNQPQLSHETGFDVVQTDSGSPSRSAAASAMRRSFSNRSPSSSSTSSSSRKRHISPGSVAANHTAGLRSPPFKVIRRRKVLHLPPDAGLLGRGRVELPRSPATAADDTFGDFLAAPFLALLNDSHFSLQPEFLLAQGVVGENQMQPFRDFGMKLDSSNAVSEASVDSFPRYSSAPVAGYKRQFPDPERPKSIDGEVEATTDPLLSEPSGEQPKIVIRRKKVRVMQPKDVVTTEVPDTLEIITVRNDVNLEGPVDKRLSTRNLPAVTASEAIISATRESVTRSKPQEMIRDEEVELPSVTTTERSVITTTTRSGLLHRRTSTAVESTSAYLTTTIPPTTTSTFTPATSTASTTRQPALVESILSLTRPRSPLAPSLTSSRTSKRKQSTSTTPRPEVDSGVYSIGTTQRTVKLTSPKYVTFTTSTELDQNHNKDDEQRAHGSSSRARAEALPRRRLESYRERHRDRTSTDTSQNTTSTTSTASPRVKSASREKSEVARVLGLLGRLRNRARKQLTRAGRRPKPGQTPIGDTESTSPYSVSTSTETSSVTALKSQTVSSTTHTTFSVETSLEPTSESVVVEVLTVPTSTFKPDSTLSKLDVSGVDSTSETPAGYPDKYSSGAEMSMQNRTGSVRLQSKPVLGETGPGVVVSTGSRLQTPVFRRGGPTRNVNSEVRKDTSNLLARRLQERKNFFSAQGVWRANSSRFAELNPILNGTPKLVIQTTSQVPVDVSSLKPSVRPKLLTTPSRTMRFSVSISPQNAVTASPRKPAIDEGNLLAILGKSKVASNRFLGASYASSISADVSPVEYHGPKELNEPLESDIAGGLEAIDATTSATVFKATASVGRPMLSNAPSYEETSERQEEQTQRYSSSNTARPKFGTNTDADRADIAPAVIHARLTTDKQQRTATITSETMTSRQSTSVPSTTEPGAPFSFSSAPSPPTRPPTPGYLSPPVQWPSSVSNPSSSLTEVVDPPLFSSDVENGLLNVQLAVEEEIVAAEEEPNGPLYLVSLLFVLPVVAVALWYLKKNQPEIRHALPKRLKSILSVDSADDCRDDFYETTVEESSVPYKPHMASDTLSRRRHWQIPRECLRLQNMLGEGHFGQVWKAEADNIRGHDGTLIVAVKNVKETASSKEHQDLIRELRIMMDLGTHPNVVTLLGCCTDSGPVLLVMEYVVFGKLLTYLRENRGRHNYYNFSHDSAVLTSRDLTLFALQVAAAMEYIAEKGIIHRDLAARNVLVDHSKTCKVCDFGMSRSLQEINVESFEPKHRGALPIRWMSPESLYYNTYNQKTDCWSYGILLWEIITLGSTPYPGLSAREVMRAVREGYRLERPDHCHPQLYQLAAGCWAAESVLRPDFRQLRQQLEILVEDESQGYVDLDRFQEEIYATLNKSSDEKV